MNGEKTMDFESITDPIAKVDELRAKAEAAGLVFPESMVLATVDEQGAPHARVVFYKGRVGRRLHFFTNYQSDKGRQLALNPRAEVCIHYASLALQIRMNGGVAQLSADISDKYFQTRPRESQIGAWASAQSRPLRSREELDLAVTKVTERYAGVPVPRPPHWGGFGLVVENVELWVGREGRLHDRARYHFDGESWRCQLLFP